MTANVEAHPERAERLHSALDSFVTSQRSILRMVDFMSEKKHEIDDRRTNIIEDLLRQYPELDLDRIEALVDVMLAGRRDDSREEILAKANVIVKELSHEYWQGAMLFDLVRAQNQPPSVPRMLESLLISLVSDFEVLIAQLARLHLEVNSDHLLSSERTFTWSEVSEHGSIEAFKAMVIDRAVDSLLLKSADKWFDFFSEKYKVRLPAVVSSVEFVEAIQRRHVVVHAGGRVTRDYLARQPKLKPQPPIGELLVVDSDYLRHASDLIMEAAFCLVANSARQIGEPETYSRLEARVANVPYRLLQDGRIDAARRLCANYRNAKFENDEQGLVMQVNYWLALKMAGRLDECRGEIESWSVGSLNSIYRLAKMALLDDLEPALELAKRARGTTELPMHFWLTWPLLAHVREYERSLNPGDGLPEIGPIDLAAEGLIVIESTVEASEAARPSGEAEVADPASDAKTTGEEVVKPVEDELEEPDEGNSERDRDDDEKFEG